MKAERAVEGARRGQAGPTTDTLVDLATRFYVAGQSQIEIARTLGLDASTVSRYLKRARDEGIVRVEIHRPRSLHGDLALELAGAFHLKKAVVVTGQAGAAGGDAVARVAADYVNSRLLNGMRLGLSWGRMLSAAIHKMPVGTVSGLDISLLHGGMGRGGAGIQGHELARHLASLHPHSHVHYLHAPVLVDSPDIKQAMMRDRSIRSALESHDGEALAGAAHALKGALGNLGGNASSQCAQRVEAIGRSRDLKDAEDAVAALETEVARLEEILTALVAAHAT